MKISEEHKQKAREIRLILANLEPEVLYHLASFMDIEDDEVMCSQCVYEAMEKADICSEDGIPQEHILRLGMHLPDIKIICNFQQTDDGRYDTDVAEIVKCTSSEQ